MATPRVIAPEGSETFPPLRATSISRDGVGCFFADAAPAGHHAAREDEADLPWGEAHRDPRDHTVNPLISLGAVHASRGSSLSAPPPEVSRLFDDVEILVLVCGRERRGINRYEQRDRLHLVGERRDRGEGARDVVAEAIAAIDREHANRCADAQRVTGKRGDARALGPFAITGTQRFWKSDSSETAHRVRQYSESSTDRIATRSYISAVAGACLQHELLLVRFVPDAREDGIEMARRCIEYSDAASTAATRHASVQRQSRRAAALACLETTSLVCGIDLAQRDADLVVRSPRLEPTDRRKPLMSSARSAIRVPEGTAERRCFELGREIPQRCTGLTEHPMRFSIANVMCQSRSTANDSIRQ